MINRLKVYLITQKSNAKTALSGFPDNRYEALAAYVYMFILWAYKTLVVYINYNTHQAL